jgi:hypothetical protein
MFFVRHAVRWNGGEEEDGEREREEQRKRTVSVIKANLN